MCFCFIFDIIILRNNWRKYENNRTYTTLRCGRKQTFYDHIMEKTRFWNAEFHQMLEMNWNLI